MSQQNSGRVASMRVLNTEEEEGRFHIDTRSVAWELIPF